MTAAKSELTDLLDFAVDLARGAGAITLKYFRRAPQTDTKADGSFVTIADRETEKFLRQSISERFPDDGLLGEEEGEYNGSSERRWIVDPIDGTFSFVHGVPFYGVMIGLEIDGKACLGVVNLPALDEIVYAAKGVGCFYNGHAARVSKTATLAESLLLSTDFGTCAQYGFGVAAAELQRAATTLHDADQAMKDAQREAERILRPYRR